MSDPAKGGTIGMDATLVIRDEPTAQSPGAVLNLETGSLFAGRYEIEALLGRGGMGVVYRARDRLVDERVALKLLDVGGQVAAEAVEMFRREVRIARRITHPHVVRIYDLGESGGLMYITMQFVEASDLRHELERRERKLEAARAARVALEIAQGLDAAHTMGVVHRDLKPENVLVDRAGRCLLSDFGIARDFDPNAAEASRTTKIVGTPAYMAPEQVAGAELGPQTDIYALGVMLFEMLAGRTPFLGDNPFAVALARLNEPPPELGAVCEAPGPLATLVAECLERDPRARPASAGVIAAELDAFLESIGGGAAPSVALPAAPRSPARTGRSTRASRGVALPFKTGRSALACLPFTFRGPAEHEYLGEAVSGELTDVLSRTKGLRVLASSATANVTERDPRKLTEELDVDYIVDGTVQVAGTRLRVSVRLVEASGAQLFSERFDIGFKDLFDMQDEAGRRIAEALRLELVARSLDVEVPDEAMELFLRARRTLRAQKILEAPQAVAQLERVLALCPAFTPALASLAIATVHVWFYPQGDRSRDWEAAAHAIVERAIRDAPGIVETHVAAARMASHQGSLRDAVLALRRAIDIAPTSPDAHNILGQLECETSRADEGIARLALAHQLEPTGVFPYEAARVAALRGDHDSYDRHMVLVEKFQSPLIAEHLKLRYAAWWDLKGGLEAVLAHAPQLGEPFAGAFISTAGAFLGRADPQMVVASLSSIMPHVNARFGNIFRQILVEVHAHAGDLDGAMEWLHEAQAAAFYDVVWLERCPLLAPLRGRPEFSAIVTDVKARCAKVWTS